MIEASCTAQALLSWGHRRTQHRQRDTDRDTERETQTDRDTDRQTDRQTQTERENNLVFKKDTTHFLREKGGRPVSTKRSSFFVQVSGYLSQCLSYFINTFLFIHLWGRFYVFIVAVVTRWEERTNVKKPFFWQEADVRLVRETTRISRITSTLINLNLNEKTRVGQLKKVRAARGT